MNRKSRTATCRSPEQTRPRLLTEYRAPAAAACSHVATGLTRRAPLPPDQGSIPLLAPRSAHPGRPRREWSGQSAQTRGQDRQDHVRHERDPPSHGEIQANTVGVFWASVAPWRKLRGVHQSGSIPLYAKCFGVRRKGGAPVDTKTIFQIGSTTKAFLSATMAIAVDRGKLHWDDRVGALDPNFQMRDPWVTRDFRFFDLLAQRSGLPPYVNDDFGVLGFDRSTLIHSLRYVEPVSSFRTTFAYTNITHILAGRIVAKAEGAADWNAVLQSDILDPLGMKDSTHSAAAITASANHAQGYRYTADGSVEVPFEDFPYVYDGAGDINSNIEDMAKWVGLQLAGGTTPAGKRIVSAENLTYTDTPKVAISDKASYALGWVIQQTPNGSIVQHNGGTHSFGAIVILQLDRKLGVIVLTNQGNVGMPDAIG